MSGVIKPYKVLSPTEMIEALDAIREAQAEIVCHVQAWLNEPRREVDERYIAARQREAVLMETIMAFDRRLWRKADVAAEAALKAEQRRRRKADQQAQYRARQRPDDQPEGEGL